MRDRQREATLAFLRTHSVEVGWSSVPNVSGLTVSWAAGSGRIQTIMGNSTDSVDDLICQIPAIKRRWVEAEQRDSIENSGTDRT